MTTIDQMIDSTITKEGGDDPHNPGGYTNDPNDPGGATIWGITEHEARAFGYQGDMRQMPRSTAVSIYKQRFYFQPRVDLIDAVNGQIAAEVFDTGVNMGVYYGAYFLQVALNVFNREAKDYPDIAEDGHLGAITAHALQSFLAKRGDVGRVRILRALNSQQGCRYIALAKARPANEEFEFGWFDRVEID